jgi:peptide/nickel transport system permease protein
VSAKQVLAKIALAVVTLLFVLVFNFFLFRAIGDPKKDLIRIPHTTQKQREQIIKDRGLDKPLFTQFGIYVRDTLSGNLETSYETRQPVWTVIKAAIPNSLILVLPATILAALLGTWMGVVAANRRGTATDGLLSNGSLTLYSMPEAFLAIALVLIFAVELQAFPTGLKVDPGSNLHGAAYVWNVIQHATLPIVCLTLSILAQWTLIMRSSMLETLHEDYITTARAIGNPRWRVLRRHAVPNSILPVIALTAISLGGVVGGVFFIETVFSWPGVGYLSFHAIQNRDIPVMEGVFLVTSAAVIIANLVADLLLGFLDPRIREA